MLDDGPIVGPPPHDPITEKTPREAVAQPRDAFRLLATMRQGTASSLPGAWERFSTEEDARLGAREMLKNDRVLRVALVSDALPRRFVEWVNR